VKLEVHADADAVALVAAGIIATEARAAVAARCRLWVVTGSDKTHMLARPREGDRSTPAGRIRQDHALDRGPRY